MTGQEFEARITEWAKKRGDVEALVLAGSRAGHQGSVDQWSDWDFHIIANQPERFYGTDWLNTIGPLWSAHSKKTPRGVIKVSAVFENGLEADFVPLPTWQMKLVYWGMARPKWKKWMPDRLQRGIQETRAFLLGSGYRVLVGGEPWVERLEATRIAWPARTMSPDEFAKQVACFWQQAVWVFKKIARPEPRSAIHWMHLLIIENVYAILAEEARVEDRVSRSEARKAENWLSAERLKQTDIVTSLDQHVLGRALLSQIDLFEQASKSVAIRRGFILEDYSAVAAWLRAELTKIAGPS